MLLTDLKLQLTSLMFLADLHLSFSFNFFNNLFAVFSIPQFHNFKIYQFKGGVAQLVRASES